MSGGSHAFGRARGGDRGGDRSPGPARVCRRARACHPAPERRRARDAGVSSVEVVLMTPLIVMLILFIVALGVMVNVRSEVEGAARDAARAGSLQGTGQDAAAQAQAAADADLGTRCQGTATVDSYYVPPVGNGGGYYKVTVSCTVNMSGFGVFGAHQTFSQTFAAPIDPLQNFHPGNVPTSSAPGPAPSTPSPTNTQFSAPTWLTPSEVPTGGSTSTVGQTPGPSGTDSLPTTPTTPSPTTPPSKTKPSSSKKPGH
ncbi:pilus assembly protein [Catenulispora sp. NF23]|uniref:Pilus assembly protein n=1 Tax=Catenulispora pinistramenti TaxID=2705254 RepID=A0ABS5L269_9ACTN|nr:TadE family protein [Catenulispora pinistramenti]MBS2535794.1 pilus assembly protein [Catenulispora pinistramenti]MBS2552269.1 pilus assembly protein [Catenulispora pinistramenti]